MVRFAASLVVVLFLVGVVQADSIFGTVRFKDGSKDKGTTAITTSYNNNQGKLDGNGNYTLDFGAKVGSKVTVYVNGKRYTEIEVKGDVRLYIVVP